MPLLPEYIIEGSDLIAHRFVVCGINDQTAGAASS